MSASVLMLTALLLPLAGAVLISLTSSRPNLRESVSVITATLLFAVILRLYQLPEEAATLVMATPVDGLEIAFALNRFGVMFALIASSLWIVTTLYAMGYMRAHHERNQTRFYILFAVSIACVMAIAFAENLLTLFLFYEVLTVGTYPLVAHAGTSTARAGARKYLLILMGSSIAFFLPAIVITYIQAGTLSFAENGILAGNMDTLYIAPLLLVFLLGISKAGIMPLHRWLPSAMVAPTPVSALLHAVAVVKAGVFTVLKVVLFIFGPDVIAQSVNTEYLLLIPMATIILASLVAMTRDNLKERLAYSTISQLSYIVLGALMVNQAALVGATLHIAMHAFAKITLFFAAGAILVAAHKTKVSELDGLASKMPITFACFAIGAMSIIGIPMLGGMWSKWYLVSGASAFTGPAWLGWALSITLMLSTLLNIWYLLTIPVNAWFKPMADTASDITEAPWPCLVAMVIPSAACVYFFFQPDLFLELAQSIVGGGKP